MADLPNPFLWRPPVSFYFRVRFGGMEPLIPDTSFSEVSGLSMELETQEVKESGENYFVHQLPQKVKHGNLVLKRALEPLLNPLEMWIHDTIDGGFNKKIKPKEISVSLLNQLGAPMCVWFFTNAFPVKWEASPFNSLTNSLVIETLELKYNEIKRLI